MVTVSAVGTPPAAIGTERAPFETVPTPAVPAVVSASAIAEGGAERARQMTGRVVHALFEADRLSAEPGANPALFFVERAELPSPKSPPETAGQDERAQAAEADAADAAEADAADADLGPVAVEAGEVEVAEADEARMAEPAAEEPALPGEPGSEVLLFQRFYSSRQTFVESVAGAWGSGTEATTMLVSDFDKRILKVRFFQDADSDDGADATFFYVSSNGRYRGSLLLV